MDLGKNTAIISIEEYDHLRKIKQGLRDLKVVKIQSGHYDFDHFFITSHEEVIEELEREIYHLTRDRERYSETVDNLNKKINQQQELIEELENRSYQIKFFRFWDWLRGK